MPKKDPRAGQCNGPREPFTAAELSNLMQSVRRLTIAPDPSSGLEPRAVLEGGPMDLLPHPVFGFDLSGRLVATNVHANRLMEERDAVCFEHDAVLEVSSGNPLWTRAGPFLMTARSGAVFEGFAQHSVHGVFVQVRDLDATHELEPGALSRLHRLTPTEAQVARLLHKGLEAALVAETLGVRLSTVRSHIKAILRKMEARDLIELARRLELGLARPLGALPTDRTKELM